MIAYADASAFAKRYLPEYGRDLTRDWLADADQVHCCRFGYVEVWRALARSGSPNVAQLHEQFEAHWAHVSKVEIDDQLTRAAAGLAVTHGLRSLDALHLAAAEPLADPELRVITGDKRLWHAARALNLAVLPESEP